METDPSNIFPFSIMEVDAPHPGTLTVFDLTEEQLDHAPNNRKECPMCQFDFHIGDKIVKNGCCSALACIECFSTFINTEHAGQHDLVRYRHRGMDIAKCQLCRKKFDAGAFKKLFPRDEELELPVLSRSGVSEIVDVEFSEPEEGILLDSMEIDNLILGMSPWEARLDPDVYRAWLFASLSTETRARIREELDQLENSFRPVADTANADAYDADGTMLSE